MALRDHTPSLLQQVTQDMQSKAAAIKTQLVEVAMRQEAPDVEALGWEVYEPMLAMDTEAPNMEMILLQREPGQPSQAIVLLLTDFPEPPLGQFDDPKISMTVTPVAGAQGWQQFQQQRARNNMRD
jgi:hypothetical protein